MKGVQFDNLHSYRDFSLVLSSKEIGEAKPKIELLEVAGADEPFDFTEFFGDIKFENRTLSFDFSVIDKSKNFLNLFSEIQNKLNGRRMKITLDEDPDFYYSGRISVKEWQSDMTIGKLTIEADCSPYKLKKNKTVINSTIAGEKTFTLHNLRKWAVPVFTTNAEMRFEFGNSSISVGVGQFRIPEITLKEGDNTLTIKGNGNVKIEYQEGSL